MCIPVGILPNTVSTKYRRRKHQTTSLQTLTSLNKQVGTPFFLQRFLDKKNKLQNTRVPETSNALTTANGWPDQSVKKAGWTPGRRGSQNSGSPAEKEHETRCFAFPLRRIACVSTSLERPCKEWSSSAGKLAVETLGNAAVFKLPERGAKHVRSEVPTLGLQWSRKIGESPTWAYSTKADYLSTACRRCGGDGEPLQLKKQHPSERPKILSKHVDCQCLTFFPFVSLCYFC